MGNPDAAIIRWTWEAHGAAQFLGVPTDGKVVGTTGLTQHVYENGRIKRESTYRDATAALVSLGQPVSALGVTAPAVRAPAAVPA